MAGGNVAARRPTIADVAGRVGVSKSLVSFVFNDRPGVAPQTRELILQTAREMGWRPRPAARALSIRRSFALGLVVRRDPSVITGDSFFPAFIAGVESVLADQGQVLVLSMVADAEAEIRAYRTLVDDRRIDGALVIDLRVEDSRLDLLTELGLPAVTLGRPVGPSPFPAVSLADYPGVQQTVQHLLALGHRRIGYVAGDVAMLHGLRRRDSFVASMGAAGLPADLVHETDFSPASAAWATQCLLEQTPRPTAIVYASDPMALAGLGVLQTLGLRAPDDVSVAGFDGTDIARYVYPALTTVVSDPIAWGREAAQTLLRLIREGAADDVELPAARLQIAQSTAPPPGEASPTPAPAPVHTPHQLRLTEEIPPCTIAP
jgi:DNA-binding LacI/PurR family transcriptional regulator